MIIDVLHFSFTVSDLDKSINWYTDILGLEVVNRQRQNNEYTKKLVGFSDAVLEVARLRIPGVENGASDHILELVQYVEAAGETVPLRTNSPGIAHFAFLVDDIVERVSRLKKLGVSFRSDPVNITEGTNRGGMACYFHGPDNETFEFLQPSPERVSQIFLDKGRG